MVDLGVSLACLLRGSHLCLDQDAGEYVVKSFVLLGRAQYLLAGSE